MLVLSRKRNEKIIVGDSIVITIIEIRQDGLVRVGIEAPREVKVLREEVAASDERKRRKSLDESGGAA
jgi:carbon storage regulator